MNPTKTETEMPREQLEGCLIMALRMLRDVFYVQGVYEDETLARFLVNMQENWKDFTKEDK